jgi:uncharacterized protein YjbI with pentapeptide repeats
MEQEPKTPREQAEDLIRLLVPDWRPTPQQVLWTVRIVVALVALLVLIRIGYALPGTGFGQTEVKQGVQPAKTLWDWMDLLIVPIVLAIVGYVFTRSESRATLEAAERQAQEEALQAYLDNIAEMLMPNNDQPSLSNEHPPKTLKTVARARTLTVLPRLAGDGKGRVVQFLHESNLISHMVQDEQSEIIEQEKVVDLRDANLRDANLVGLNLRGVALGLGGVALARRVDLERANLRYADLQDADLSFASLQNADLYGSVLSGADLSSANLSGASLNFARSAPKAATLSLANLSNADLRNADLRNADLRNADLRNANLINANLRSVVLQGTKLSGAYLSGADLTDARECTYEQLAQAKSLDSATMPDGRVLKGDKTPHGPTFEEWRKSREGQG